MGAPRLIYFVSRREIGFTLVELMIVLLLIGVMASSAVVALQGREDPHALRVAADDLAAALRYAKQQSAQTGRVHRVLFTDDYRSYQIESAVLANTEESGFTPVRGMAGQHHQIVEGVTLLNADMIPLGDLEISDEVSAPLAFNFGQGAHQFTGELILQNQAMESLRVVVLPQTGQIRVLEPQ